MKLQSFGLGVTIRPRLPIRVVVAGLILASFCALPAAAQDQGDDSDRSSAERNEGVLGDGRTIRLGRATWDTGWFQADVLAQLLSELGFTVEGPRSYTNEQFYQGLTDGHINLWANEKVGTHL